MKKEVLHPLLYKTKNDLQKFGGHWFRGNNCNFIPSKKHFKDIDFFEKYIIKGFKPKKPFISKKNNVLAFGSCFAAEVSKYLADKNYSIFNKKYSTDAHIIRYGEGMANTFTVLEQLLWAFDNKNIEKNTWYSSPDEEVRNDQEIRKETLRLLNQIDVFIITVGLSEVWYNKQNNQVFWKAIPANKFDDDKHGFRISSVDENTNNLENIYNIIKKNKPNASVIFTLSPIPLMATFRPQSCITANSVSKSILRVSLDNIISKYKKNEDIYYFPSFEIVKDYFVDPFMADNRHLKKESILEIMKLFEKNYCF
jgi:hypothetical protein